MKRLFNCKNLRTHSNIRDPVLNHHSCFFKIYFNIIFILWLVLASGLSLSDCPRLLLFPIRTTHTHTHTQPPDLNCIPNAFKHVINNCFSLHEGSDINRSEIVCVSNWNRPIVLCLTFWSLNYHLIERRVTWFFKDQERDRVSSWKMTGKWDVIPCDQTSRVLKQERYRVA